MILHPGIMALLLGTAAAIFLLAVGSVVGIRVLAGWQAESGSEKQLRLERQTHLATAAVKLALAFTALSIFLFIYTVDDLHRLIVGAMCATGSLNAAPGGWYVLAAKGLLLFLSSGWLLLNSIDESCETLPFVRPKYTLLLLIAPLVLVDGALQLRYFLAIHPDIITSCCGSLFTTGEDTVVSTVSALPPRTALIFFYGAALLFFLSGLLRLARSSGALSVLFAAAATAMLPISLSAIVSVFSLYLYESPVHHCPFDFLQGAYGYIGYPIYASLFAAVIYGLAVGVFSPLAAGPPAGPAVALRQRRWTLYSLLLMALFVLLVSWAPLFGGFRLLPYG